MNKKINYLMIIFLLMFFCLLIMLLTIDKQINYLTGTKVGLYTLNNFFISNIKYNNYIFVSDFILILGFIFVFIIVLLEIIKLVKTKNMNDINIITIIFCIYMFILFVLWFIFENIIIINYRPVLINQKLESSFPSTHVLFVTFIYLASSKYIDFNNKPKMIKNIFYYYVILSILITSVIRIICGMHWLTDVIGSLLLGIFLYLTYCLVINKYYKK